MKKKYITPFFISLFLGILLFAGTASASTLNFNQVLTVTTDGTINPFGVSDGSSVTVAISIDSDTGDSDSGYTMHTYTTDGSVFSLEFTLGTTNFDETMDISYLLVDGGPYVTIKDSSGLIDLIDFKSEVNGYTVTIGLDQQGTMGMTVVESPNIVPEPGTFALLSLALLSFAGLKRRQS